MPEVGNNENIQQSSQKPQQKKVGFGRLAFWKAPKELPVVSTSSSQVSTDEPLAEVNSVLATMNTEVTPTPEATTIAENRATSDGAISISEKKEHEPLDFYDVLEEETAAAAVPDAAVESNKQLRPAHKIFFHTTPSKNVASLREHGLMAHNNTDTLGRDLLYSLAFAEEFNDINRAPIRDFTLTVWENSDDIKRRIMPNGSISDAQYTAAGNLESNSMPGMYQQNLADRRFGHRGAPEDTKGVSAEHLLATIPITEESQRLLVQCKLDFLNNIATGEEIEQRLLTFVQSPESGIQLGTQTKPGDVAHDLAARMQQEVLRYEVDSLAQSAIRQINELQYGTTTTPKILTNELAEIRTKAERINDPLSQRYVSMLATQCRSALDKKGIEEKYSQAKSDVSDVYEWAGDIGVDYNKLWGGNDGWRLVRRIRENTV